jgi:hypothetical protein
MPLTLEDTELTLTVAQLGTVCKRFRLLSEWSQTVTLDGG